MSAEFSKPGFDYKATRPFEAQDYAWFLKSPAVVNIPPLENAVAKNIRKERVPRPEGYGIARWVEHFDAHGQQEGLPQNWENLQARSGKKVGFMMDREMNMLEDPFDKPQLTAWVQKVKRNLQGYKLEFLSDNVIFPRLYKWNKSDPRRLEDPLYGKAKDGVNDADIAEIISDDERNGSVKKAIERAKTFMQDAPEGSIVVTTSPKGKTGLRTDSGVEIEYDDAYFFIKLQTPAGVMNYTLKTDFSNESCREVIAQLTGEKLAEDASLEAYAEAQAKIKPGEHPRIRSVQDVVKLISEVQPSHAFIDDSDKKNIKITKWEDVYEQVEQGEELYEFDVKTKEVIDEFERFGLMGIYPKEYLRKGIAASILLMGLINKKESQMGKHERDLEEGKWYISPETGNRVLISEEDWSFGEVLEHTAAKRGCAGGGGAIIVTTMGGLKIVIRQAGLQTPGEDGAGGLTFRCSNNHPMSRTNGSLKSVCRMCVAEGAEAAIC